MDHTYFEKLGSYSTTDFSHDHGLVHTLQVVTEVSSHSPEQCGPLNAFPACILDYVKIQLKKNTV